MKKLFYNIVSGMSYYVSRMTNGFIRNTVYVIRNTFKPKLTFKTWLFFVVSIFIIGIGIYLLQQTQDAKAAWFDDQWRYRQRIHITNAGSTLSNYQVGFTMNTGALYAAGKIDLVCSDVRVVAEDGTVLPHWREESDDFDCSSSSIQQRFWTKLPSIPTTGINIYIYYGNPTATNTKNPKEVFEFFDDFNLAFGEPVDNNIWDGHISNFSIINGMLYGNDTRYRLTSKIAFTGNYRAVTRHKVSAFATNGHVPLGFKQIGTTANAYGTMYHPTDVWYTRNNNAWVNQGSTVDLNQWTRLEVKVVGTAGTANLVGETSGSDSASDTNNSGLSSENLTIGTRYDDLNLNQTYAASWDYIFVTKAVATEPVASISAGEEQGPGPVAHWKFDEGRGDTLYDSVGINNGTMGSGSSAPSWVSEEMCISGKCLSFDGVDDFVQVPDSNQLDYDDSIYTIQTWVKPDNFSTQSTIVSKRLNNNNKEYAITITTNGTVGFDRYLPSGGNVVGTESLSANQWNHLSVVVDDPNNQVLIYINGRLSSTHSYTEEYTGTQTGPLFIGKDPTDNIYFNGLMDELKIYPYALTSKQIKADYAAHGASEGVSARLGNDDIQRSLFEGLVGYWKMDENTGTTAYDLSGYGNNGTLQSGATWSNGKYRSAVNTNSSSARVDVPDPANGSLDFTQNDNFTFAAWVNTTVTGTSMVFIEKNFGGGSPGYRVRVDTSSRPVCQLSDSTAGTDQVGTSRSIADGNWHHIVCVVQKNTPAKSISVYIDGTLANSAVPTHVGSHANSEPLRIGLDSGSSYFRGSIDHVQIYKRALAPSEVKMLYEWGPDPVGYWKMDEGNGTTINDSSGNELHGTLTGGAYFWVPGQYGHGIGVSGGYVDLGNPALLQSFRSLTISGWIEGTTFTPSNHNMILSKVTDYYLSIYNSRLNFRSADLSSDTTTGTTVLSTGTKYYVTVTYDGSMVRLYINGVLDASEASTGTISSTATNVKIGVYYDNSLDFMGAMDDIKIYDYARSQKQIVQDMNAGHPMVGSPVGSPVGYWKLDEGYGSTINNAGNVGSTINGVIAGTSAPTWTNDGRFGKALNFDGTDDYITIIDNAAVKPANAVTVSAWVNPENVAQWHQVITKRYHATNNPFNSYILGTNNGGASNRWQFCVSTGVSGSQSCADDIQTLQPNTWTHLVGTYDGSNILLYTDGMLKSSIGMTGTIGYSNLPLRIGTATAASGTFMKGKIDEVKVYSYALTADEVKVDFNQSKALVLGSVSTGIGGTTPSQSSGRGYCVPGDTSLCNSPVGEWKFDEGVGTTAYDTSSNGLNGILGTGTSSPGWTTGIKGKALRFDGISNYVQIPDNASLKGMSGLTISAWIKADVFSTTREIVQKENTYNFRITATELECWVHNGATYINVADTLNSNFSTQAWTHVACTWTAGGGGRIYVNGVDVTVNSLTASAMASNINVVTIGSRNSSQYFSGTIDDVRIYNYARTPAQIAWDYSKGTPVAWYKMDECEGSTIYNSAPTFNDEAPGINGTLTLGSNGVTSVGTCATSGAWANGATGKRGASMSFDGSDDYIDIGDSQNISFGDGTTDKPFSVASWIYMNDATNFQFVNKTPASNPLTNMEWGFGSGATDLLGFVLYDNSALVLIGKYVITPMTVYENQWIHVTASYDGSETTNGMKIYINGIEQETGPLSNGSYQGMHNTTSPLRIGAVLPSAPSASFANGKVDDVRIYNYVLTPSQVKTVYNNGAVSFE